MELVLGKQFKLEVWEVIVQKMALNEVAVFTVDKSVNITLYNTSNLRPLIEIKFVVLVG